MGYRSKKGLVLGQRGGEEPPKNRVSVRCNLSLMLTLLQAYLPPSAGHGQTAVQLLAPHRGWGDEQRPSPPSLNSSLTPSGHKTCLVPLSVGSSCHLRLLVETEGSPPSTASMSSPKPKQRYHLREEGMKFNEPNVTGKCQKE